MQANRQTDDVVIAAAQCVSVAGDIAANVQRHLRFMAAAVEQGVSFLLFPELSLTGYEPAMARKLAITPDDPRLQPLKDLAQELKVVTVVGAPVQAQDSDNVLIAALVFGPDSALDVYTKQHLHAGEESVFQTGIGGAAFDLGPERIALAVCADFGQATHPQVAAQSGASLYAASVLISDGGYAHDSVLLGGYAQQHGMAVLIANHGGVTGGWQSAGRSALWSETGALLGRIPGTGNALLIGTRTPKGWVARCLPVNA